MQVLFCSEPFSPATVDTAFEDEWNAVKAAGLTTAFIDFEAVIEGELDRAVRGVKAPGLAVYRGWMLKPTQYQALHAALAHRGVELINDPTAYEHCHYLPRCYDVLEGFTPHTVWLPVVGEIDMGPIMAALAELGPVPAIVKDYVKSQKHYWNDACYIGDPTDRTAVERVVRRFLELQGDDLNEGLVFREHVALRPAGEHPQSGMPLSVEHRLFWLDGELLISGSYWSGGESAHEAPTERFKGLAKKVRSRFFSMDIALRDDGTWIVVELGDGQVSGLQGCPASRFYAELAAWVARAE